jgi:hypothetical protein
MNMNDFDWDRIQSLGFSEETVKNLKDTYKKGLTPEEESKAKSTIKKTMAKAKEGGADAKELYKDWESDKSFNKRLKDSGKEMPKSPATEAYDKMYDDNSESEDHAEGSDKSLAGKARSSGIPVGILKKVFAKGMAAWRSGHRPGVGAQQWAHARVNSFITGSGGARKADADLWKQAQAAKGKKD